MKLIQKGFSLVIVLVVLANFPLFCIVQVTAHDAMLEVAYDNCVYVSSDDGIDEAWYVLDNTTVCRHLSHEEHTIKYYFEESSEDGTYTWTTDVSETVAEEIKTAYANSMKKWNDVYFYSYDSSGNVVKNKIINIVEGTITDHNLSIYPGIGADYVAETNIAGTSEPIETGDVDHRHYSEWKMTVYVNHFYVHTGYDAYYVNSVRARIGAHEFGHVLGLRDVDNYCNSTSSSQHHHELLMGYGRPQESRQQNITYKDVAGVAITRGFHTDADHKWLNCGLQSDGTYKLICSICNGVNKVDSLNGYTYDTYASCDNNHTLSSENMMAVASCGVQDYYKCRYCRYVAPYSSIVTQNYSVSASSDTHHKYVNNILGLNYTFYEEHSMTQNTCSICGYLHTHSFEAYMYFDNSTHVRLCDCGATETETHYVRRSDIVDDRYAQCLGCDRLLDLNEDMARVEQLNVTQVTVNGSYILPSGIVVLEDADIEAYINGTLQFYNIDDIPVTE